MPSEEDKKHHIFALAILSVLEIAQGREIWHWALRQDVADVYAVHIRMRDFMEVIAKLDNRRLLTISPAEEEFDKDLMAFGYFDASSHDRLRITEKGLLALEAIRSTLKEALPSD